MNDPPIAEDMSQGHYFVGVGNAKQWQPNEEEIRIIRETGEEIDEHTIVRTHLKAKIHGVDYRIHDNKRREFCDSIACTNGSFFSIIRILSYRDGERTVAGFIGKEFKVIGNLCGTIHIKEVVLTNNIRFVSYHDVTVPGIVFYVNKKHHAIPVTNISSVD